MIDNDVYDNIWTKKYDELIKYIKKNRKMITINCRTL